MTMQATLFETVEERSVKQAFAALHSEAIGFRPASRQIALLRLLMDRRGAQRAVSAADLAKFLNCDDRDIRGDVRDLRMLFRVPIGSARTAQSGYYLITTTEELFDTVRPFLSQANSELRLVRALCSPRELAELAGQMNLNLNDLHAKEIDHAE